METLPLISVIVPVYNAEKWIDRCIRTLVNQTWTNMEIIIVDDGSTDSSYLICERWSNIDKRIRLLRQNNRGGAAARNTGLFASNGDYITFVDSDDYVSDNIYERLYELITVYEADIAECGHIQVCNENDIAPNRLEHKIDVFSGYEALKDNIDDNKCKHVVWDKLYRKETIGNIVFTEGKYIDDVYFTYLVLANAKKIVVTDEVLYYYWQQEESVTHQRYSIKYVDAIEAKRRRLQFFEEKYPDLVQLGWRDFQLTSIYHGQQALLHGATGETNIILEAISSLLKTQKLKWNYLLNMKLKNAVWIVCAHISLVSTCKIRNFLKIGL